MVALRFPEVLAHDWLPPVLIGRTHEVGDAVRRLDPPVPSADPPWIVGVAGPSGAGTSAVARRAARETVDRLRAFRAEPAPRTWAVRVGNLRGTHGVATGLLRHLDEGFDGRGFPVAEILAGFLRRIRREGRPTVLVLDDLSSSDPDLAPILRAFGNPDRFLPEGQNGIPPFWTIVAGTPEALARLRDRLADQIPLGPFVRLAPYDERTLAAVITDRAERALGRPLSPGIAARIVARCLEEGGGARRAIDLVRRELVRGSIGGLEDPPIRLDPDGVSVEPRVVRAIGAASCGVAALLGDVKRCEADLARAQGQRPLPTTTLWRRIVRLERAGYVKREIRTGGNGGTRSLVRVLTPIDEWVTSPHPRDSLRDAVPWTGARSPLGSPAPAPSPVRPGWFPGPNGA
jgi:hypothetical protein